MDKRKLVNTFSECLEYALFKKDNGYSQDDNGRLTVDTFDINRAIEEFEAKWGKLLDD